MVPGSLIYEFASKFMKDQEKEDLILSENETK